MRTLKVTVTVLLFLLFLAGECHLRDLRLKQLSDLLVCDIAHLVVVLDNLAVLIADAAVLGGSECVADVISRTDIAVDAGPAIVAVACLLRSHRSIEILVGERAAHLK